jgi:hypothetical protein
MRELYKTYTSFSKIQNNNFYAYLLFIIKLSTVFLKRAKYIFYYRNSPFFSFSVMCQQRVNQQ